MLLPFQPSRLLAGFTLLAGVFLYLGHFGVVVYYAAEHPFADDWDFLRPGALSWGLSPSWLFALHNEHRILTAKFLVWALFRLNGWNLIVHQAINFLLYGLLLLTVVRICAGTIPEIPAWAFTAFALFLLSPIGVDNHFGGMQASNQFALLFFFLAIPLLFFERPTLLRSGTGAFFAILSAYFLANGIVFAIVLVMLSVNWELTRPPGSRAGQTFPARFLRPLVVGGVLLVATAGLFIGSQKPPLHPQLEFPTRWAFRRHYLALVSTAVGIGSKNPLGGLLCWVLPCSRCSAQPSTTRGGRPFPSGRQQWPSSGC